MGPGGFITEARRAAKQALRGRHKGGQTPAVPSTLIALARSGPAALTAPPAPAPGSLRIAILVPSFRQGSGGHATIAHLARALGGRGHSVNLWLEDFEHRHDRDGSAATKRRFAQYFRADDLDLQTDFARWDGADVVVATGWQTVPRALLLPGAAGRAYLVQDHEPEFYGASAQALFAATSYRQGLHCIAASRWLAAVLRSRYGTSTSHFDLAVDHSVYHAGADVRRTDLVAFYARSATPRRAVPLGLLALEELSRVRPEIDIALFGGHDSPYAPFPHTNLGVLQGAGPARLYRRATVGLVFSLTNPSLVGLEMMACGLPCVELTSDAVLASFGADGPLRLAEPDPVAVCSTIVALLDDLGERERLARQGPAFMKARTWSRAAEQVEEGLRVALTRVEEDVDPAQPADEPS
jgi:glycosyltransferase involved in cell wall biosynthesis